MTRHILFTEPTVCCSHSTRFSYRRKVVISVAQASLVLLIKRNYFYFMSRKYKFHDQDKLYFISFARNGTRTLAPMWGIGLAMSGYLSPLAAALIHVTSELAFILNSARLFGNSRLSSQPVTLSS